jgi:hypothetical protein
MGRLYWRLAESLFFLLSTKPVRPLISQISITKRGILKIWTPNSVAPILKFFLCLILSHYEVGFVIQTYLHSFTVQRLCVSVHTAKEKDVPFIAVFHTQFASPWFSRYKSIVANLITLHTRFSFCVSSSPYFRFRLNLVYIYVSSSATVSLVRIGPTWSLLYIKPRSVYTQSWYNHNIVILRLYIEISHILHP